MFNLSPKNDKFFDMFISFSEMIHTSAGMLKNFMEDPSNSEQKYKKIKEIEHSGDEKLHEIFEELHNSFITPIDREDIYAIGKAMDDILDFIEATASRFVMFNVVSSTEQALVFAQLVEEGTKEVIGLMKEMKKMSKSKEIDSKIVEINRIENEGDVTFRRAVRMLFDGQTSAIQVIIWKEIYESLENILNACEDTANIVEGVVMKHA